MPGKKTLKRVTVGTIATIMSMAFLPSAAHASGYTECAPWNSTLQICTRWERLWTEEGGFGPYVPVSTWYQPYPNGVDTIDP